MSTILIYLFFLLKSSSFLYQNEKPTLMPCDSNHCVTNRIRPGDFIRPTAQELTQKSISGLDKETEMGDYSCNFPTFYRFQKEGENNIVVDNGKRRGLLIKIERENSCDVNKESQAVPILYKGENHFAVTSYDGNSVFMHESFFFVLTTDSLWCKGLPAEPSRYHTCKLCNMKYVSQLFKSKDKFNNSIDSVSYYTTGGCLKSQTGNHDNLVLGPGKGCGIKGSSF